MRTVVIIPARYNSSRFPGKPLVKLLDKPMIIWVAAIAEKAVGRENVYIATDDKRIAEVVNEHGYATVMTSSTALTGTDRLAEASKQISADIFINVQGDEPLIEANDILRIRDQKSQFMDQVINGFCWLNEYEDANNVNIPKVITNEKNQLIYMSRNPLPGYKDQKNAPKKYKKQVCIYAFTKCELLSFYEFGRKSELEHHEDIEILRFLELGKIIKMVETKPGSLAVDAPEDVALVEKALEELG